MTRRGLDNEEFVVQIADALCIHGLRLPALIGLEAGRPLSLIGGQVLWLLQPLLGLVVSRDLVGNAARLLEEPEALDELIDQLEARES
ncbi:MAG: hypothetical protein WA996_11280 [Candidatus Promineifilaceae bacterium]